MFIKYCFPVIFSVSLFNGRMKAKLTLLLVTLLFCAHGSFAQKMIVENARREAVLVPAVGQPAQPDRKACAVMNRSTDRVITVRIEESVMINDFVETKIVAIEKIAPRERRFIGYSGCETDALSRRCVGYKIIVSYYDDVRRGTPKPRMKATSAVAAFPAPGAGTSSVH